LDDGIGEFMMTYGWAISVVLAACGALAYFGVFDSERFIPQNTETPEVIPIVESISIPKEAPQEILEGGCLQGCETYQRIMFESGDYTKVGSLELKAHLRTCKDHCIE